MTKHKLIGLLIACGTGLGTLPSQAQPSPGPPVAHPRTTPPLSDKLAVSERARDDYALRFEQARQMLLDGDETAAASAFAQLATIAPSAEERRLCLEFESLALAADGRSQEPKPYRPIRTSDELSILYTSAFLYGFGTSAWVALQVEPKSFAGALLPFAGLTAASIGAVAIADDYRPFALGVPRSITAGMYLGFAEGALLTGFQHARATRRDDDSRLGAKTTASLLWAGATAGAIAGGAIGAKVRPAPGRVSLVSSAALWSGLASAFLGAAVQPNRERRSETAFGAGAIGYNVGLVGALVLSSEASPSVARVRFIDLGVLAGGLLGASGYALARGSDSGPRGGLTSATVGMLGGLGFAWWATSDMDTDEPRTSWTATPSLGRTANDDWLLQVSGTF